MTLLLLACAEPAVYPNGPEVFDEPLEVHEDDAFLFAVDRINRIDLEVDEDAQEILLAQRRMSYPRDKVRTRSNRSAKRGSRYPPTRPVAPVRRTPPLLCRASFTPEFSIVR